MCKTDSLIDIHFEDVRHCDVGFQNHNNKMEHFSDKISKGATFLYTPFAFSVKVFNKIGDILEQRN